MRDSVGPCQALSLRKRVRSFATCVWTDQQIALYLHGIREGWSRFTEARGSIFRTVGSWLTIIVPFQSRWGPKWGFGSSLSREIPR
jgi:hypothetical protein